MQQLSIVLIIKASLVRIFLLICLLNIAPVYAASDHFCPPVFKKGTLGPLTFAPAFVSIEQFNTSNDKQRDGLLISSFFNSIKDLSGERVIGYFENDLVARIENIGNIKPEDFKPDKDVERLTDISGDTPVTVWPNSVDRAPDGFLPFEAVVVPGGFHAATPPGRLSIINLDDSNRQEYIVDQSTQISGEPCSFPPDANNAPRFYHDVKYVDMDKDGLLDLVSVRAAFKLVGTRCTPPVGEVVWFKNPGGDLDPKSEWQEFVISGFPNNPFSAEVSLDVYDFETDGIPEIVGTHFYNNNHITLYGAPIGKLWSSVDPYNMPPRTKTIVHDQGKPFSIEVADINQDGKMDILATNHQSDNCFDITQDKIPGRVFVVEQPTSGDLFNDSWPLHILKDNIRPNPSFPQPARGPGRLAPGYATHFWPIRSWQNKRKPWIVLSGDEASRVWILKPKNQHSNNWDYDSAVIFDINEHYGSNTSQMLTAPAPSQGNSISTVGKVGIRYDHLGSSGHAEMYIPVFEARDIHIFSFRYQGVNTEVSCPEDVGVACPLVNTLF